MQTKKATKTKEDSCPEVPVPTRLDLAIHLMELVAQNPALPLSPELGGAVNSVLVEHLVGPKPTPDPVQG